MLVLSLLAVVAIPLPLEDTTPPRRAHHSLVYDAVGRRVLLTGGSTPVAGGQRFEFFNDLWAFDGRRWTALPPSGPKVSGSQLAYDAAEKRVVAFGGYDGRSLADVRILERDTWRTLGQHPAVAAAEPGFVYDTRRQRFVAFGGAAPRGQINDATWDFDGTRWTPVATASPPARQGHVMVYDERRGRIVLFGGAGAGPSGRPPPALGDTWEFDGQSWTEQRVAGPTARFAAGAAYDSKRGEVIVFGGLTKDGFQGDTWAFNGTAWRKVAESGPEPRAMGYLAYDAARDRTVLFGGRKGYPDGDLNDTWEWDGSSWHRVGAAPVPALEGSGAFFAPSVVDLDASVRWYADKLGLQVVMRVPKQDKSAVAVLEGGGLMVEPIQHDDATPRGNLLSHGVFKAGVIVANYAQALELLRGRQVEIAHGPFPASATQRANVIIRDNAGNLIQMIAK